MSGISRRTVVGILGTGAIGAGSTAFALFHWFAPFDPAGAPAVGRNTVSAENRLAGSRRWKLGADGTKAADDHRQQIKGYASATSVGLGQSIGFHVSLRPARYFVVTVYRLGWYGGTGARLMTESPRLFGSPQPGPRLDAATGLITCSWARSWTLDVPPHWTSGAYVAVFTNADGYRSYTPFVVRDDGRTADVCVVLPFTTYQAYNQWPLDGKLGKSLYYGFGGEAPGVHGEHNGTVRTSREGPLSYTGRARKVSFDRPYAGSGLPLRADLDHDFIQWVEQCGYDVTYAGSLDLHEGRVSPARYAALVFSGHDEYWSRSMRDTVTRGMSAGTHLAYMTANNVYWHVRFEPSSDGRPNRVMTCYKTDPDPASGAGGPTTLWRSVAWDASQAEQGLLGVQYNGIVHGCSPLVVRGADHWLWAGTGVRDGDTIPKLVGGEADGVDPHMPVPRNVQQVLLSASAYRSRDGVPAVRQQSTSLYQTPKGALVFVAATFNWPMGLARPGYRDARIRRATVNLFDRMCCRV